MSTVWLEIKAFSRISLPLTFKAIENTQLFGKGCVLSEGRVRLNDINDTLLFLSHTVHIRTTKHIVIYLANLDNKT